MKVVVIDLDGVNNGPVVKALLAQRYPTAEITVVSASDKTVKEGKARKTTHKMVKAAKAVLGLDIEVLESQPAVLESLANADKVICENDNNVKLVTRRLGKEIFVGKSLVELGVKSGHVIKPLEMETHLKDLSEKVQAVTL